MFSDTLTNLGLTNEEAELYLSLLNNGSQTASQLAQSTSVKRTYVYALSESLIKHGLVRQEKVGKKTTFIATAPDKLLDMAETQRLQMEQAKIGLENILPQLKTIYATSEEKPVVTHYEGVEGIKKAYLETIEPGQEILAYVQYRMSTHQEIDQLEKFWPKYFQLRQKHQVFARVISPDTPQARGYQAKDKEQLRQIILVPDLDFPEDLEKNIVGNKIFTLARRGNTPIATIIENQVMAKAERALFESLWKSYSTTQ